MSAREVEVLALVAARKLRQMAAQFQLFGAEAVGQKAELADADQADFPRRPYR